MCGRSWPASGWLSMPSGRRRRAAGWALRRASIAPSTMRGGRCNWHASWVSPAWRATGGQLPLEDLLLLLKGHDFRGPLVVDVRDLPNGVAGAQQAAALLRRMLP